ncbi:bifunctional phosphoglucose/phosphomannose isomerase, partial [bacterium]|nr:bifunctional phosphoglucose/phosphomannose isomerase [bacterium]
MNFAEKLIKIDKSKMLDVLGGFPTQIQVSERIVQETILNIDKTKVTSIVITGLGGSAISGDLLKTYLESRLEIPVFVNRSYFLPKFVSEKTLVVVSSYSGNTEETVSALHDAKKRKSQILCVTTGGEIEKIAKQNCVKIPMGLQPRAALGYSFFVIFGLLAKIGFFDFPKQDVEETIKLLVEKAKEYFFDPENNFPLNLAKRLTDKIILVYGSSDLHKIVAVRWKGQFCENAEHFSFANEVPEMNHNELVAFTKKND